MYQKFIQNERTAYNSRNSGINLVPRFIPDKEYRKKLSKNEIIFKKFKNKKFKENLIAYF